MSEYRRIRTAGATYFFTVVTYQRRRFLCLDDVSPLLLTAMNEITQELKITMPAWVILPDHLHCLWTMPDSSSNFSKAWALIKRRLTKTLKNSTIQFAPLSESRIGRNESAVWQRRFWEHQIRDQKDYDVHFHYIHFNPVKHGLVRNVSDWPNSSFGQYVQNGVYGPDWGGLKEWPLGIGGE